MILLYKKTDAKKILTALAVVALASCGFFSAFAQDAVPAAAPVPVDPAAAPAATDATAAAVPGQPDQAVAAVPEIAGGVDPNAIGPIVFTYWEHAAINDARKARGFSRVPTVGELGEDGDGPLERIKPPPEEREIKLGGILYVSNKDWTIWLNGKRVTPTAIPKEVIDLKVHEEFVELKWFDDYSNKIFPLRLRPHQRFNIDTHIFLPGAG